MIKQTLDSLSIQNIKREDKKISFEVYSSDALSQDIYFACDIFANGERIHKLPYQKANCFSFLLHKSCVIDVKLYVLNKKSRERLAKNIRLGDFYQFSSFYEIYNDEYLSIDLAERGKNLLELNQLFIHNNFPSTAIQLDSIDWALDPYNNRTWRWAFLQLLILNDIVSYIEFLSSQEFLEKQAIYQKGLNIIQSFAGYLSKCEKTDAELWHDHGTALRVKNIAFYWVYGLTRGFLTPASLGSGFLKRFIEKHLLKLSKDDFYSALTNHGFDQSLILLQVACELESLIVENNYQSLAIKRIKQELDFVFTEEGGHKENSPAYLNFGLKQMMQAFAVESCYYPKGALYQQFRAIFNKAANLLAYTVKPDGYLPMVGDTALFNVSNIFTRYKPDCFDEYLYSIRQGKTGQSPQHNFLVLEKTGYVVARTWHADNFHKNFFFMFKNCHMSNYHRHDDDLSFVLSDDGEDWFIDGGIYKYEPKSPHRIYIRSAKSHNVTMPSKGRVNRQIFNAYNGINVHQQTEKSISFSGSTSMYVGYHYERQVELDIEKKQIILNDRLYSKNGQEKENFVSRFFIAADKQVVIEDKTVIIKGKNKNIALTVNSKIPYSLHLVKKPKDKIEGWLSSGIATLHQVNLLEIHYNDISGLDASYIIEF